MNQNTNHSIPWNKIKYLLVDLDDTLYPQNSGLWELIRMRINKFLVNELHFSEDEAPAIRHQLWKQYGTTLRGLQMEYKVDMDAYLAYVHDVPIDNLISYDQQLSDILNALPQQKIIFTNASADHANRVTELLGITRYFEDIIDIYALSPFCKPQVEAFHTVLEKLNMPSKACLLVDDSPENLETAQILGMSTVSVGNRVHPLSPHISTFHDFLTLLNQ